MPAKTKSRSTFDKLLAFKIVDPVAQTALLMYYFYVLDEGGTSFRTVFFALLVIQVVSFTANYFLDFYKKLKIERVLSIGVLLIWFALYYYVTTHVREVHVTDLDLSVFAKTGIHDFYLMLTGLVISIWYFSVCFREMRWIVKRKQKKGG